ncbi:hypothetical protein CNMCM5793_002191 [Aspergillus hiratsukae]|uniref:Uncharacterized protein n=1 Tax=Aspergillus hiratsukae TaxID=1194566 RepID=A0A8H6UVW9_9EURO|nr:hypothetical protein CNMCM5793_002191 [Aspergillus hiratsukae]KAF7164885.1 hypothetical protein CNMCM6106_001270 [Aspergillus hiratsukae]
MDAIRDKHKGLIDGLTQIFDLWVKAQYISATDILTPPHHNIDIPRLQRLGYDSEVLDLVPTLPALRNEAVWGYQEEGVELIPRAKLVNYFAQPNRSLGDELLEDLRWVDWTNKERYGILPPGLLRLTLPGFYGVHLLYDTQDQSIIEWCELDTEPWADRPRRHSEVFFSEILHRFQTLEYVPFYNPNDWAAVPKRRIEDHAFIFQNMFPGGIRLPMDEKTAIQHLSDQPETKDHIRQRLNYWRALQKLYRDAGWGEVFDGESFRVKWREWLKRATDMRFKESEWNSQPIQGLSSQQQRNREEFRRQWEAFWIESAGENAV